MKDYIVPAEDLENYIKRSIRRRIILGLVLAELIVTEHALFVV